MKNYKEIIEKYKNNTLTPQEKKEFETEIESSTELLDFLLEKEQFDFFEDSHSLEQDTNLNEANLKKNIRKRISKLIILITVIVLTLIAISFYSIPKVIDYLFYNPLEGQVLTKTTNKIEVPSDYEMREYISNQIDLDEDPLTAMMIEKTGTANYTVSKEYYNSFRGEKYLNKEVINKGSLVSSINDSMNKYSLLYGENSEVGVDVSLAETSELNEKINQLPDSSHLKVTLSFKSEQNWTNLISYLKKHPNILVYSASISNVESNQNIGIRFNPVTNLNSELTNFEFSNDVTNRFDKKYNNLLNKPTLNSSEADVKKFILSNINYLNDDLSKQDKNPALTIDKKIQLKDNDTIMFSNITVSFAKSEWNSIIKEDLFHSVILNDLSLFSNFN